MACRIAVRKTAPITPSQAADSINTINIACRITIQDIAMYIPSHQTADSVETIDIADRIAYRNIAQTKSHKAAYFHSAVYPAC